MKLIVEQYGAEDGDWELAAHSWSWREVDKELFIGQFTGLRIIAHYLDVRRDLKTTKDQVRVDGGGGSQGVVSATWNSLCAVTDLASTSVGTCGSLPR